MKKLSMAAIAVALLATPVVSAYAYPDAETADSIVWQQVVDQANANRLGTAQIQKQGDVAAVKANQASDAAQAAKGQAATAQSPTKYHNVQEIREDN